MNVGINTAADKTQPLFPFSPQGHDAFDKNSLPNLPAFCSDEVLKSSWSKDTVAVDDGLVVELILFKK